MTLDKELQGVQPDPPPGDEPTEPTKPVETVVEPTVGDDGKGRTVEQSHRELARKQEKFQKELVESMQESQKDIMGTMMTKFGEIADTLKTPAQPTTKTGDSLDNMAVSELKAIRENVPEDKRTAFDEYVLDRTIKEQVDSQVNQFRQSFDVEQTRKQAAQTATTRYPQLVDKNSEFYRAVDTEVRQRGEQYMQKNSDAVLTIANEVAIRMGVDARRVRRAPPGSPAKSGSQPVGEQGDKVETISVEAAESIAASLQNAMGGKKFDIAKIQERHAAYVKDQRLHVRG